MKISFTAAALAFVLAAMPFVCVYASPPQLPSDQAAATASTERRISISNFTFSPATLEVPPGTSLRWINDDDVPHTVLGSDKDSVIRSPALDTNDGYSVVLSQPGAYRY